MQKKCFQERNGIFSTNKQFLDAKIFYKCPVNVITNKIYFMLRSQRLVGQYFLRIHLRDIKG